jgi:hypothetical protein
MCFIWPFGPFCSWLSHEQCLKHDPKFSVPESIAKSFSSPQTDPAFTFSSLRAFVDTRWMCVVLFQPLIKLMETSDRMIESEAAKGLPTATGSAGFCASSTSSLFNNPFSCSSSSKLTTQPPISATGQKVSPGQWLEHNHSDIKAKACAPRLLCI